MVKTSVEGGKPKELSESVSRTITTEHTLYYQRLLNYNIANITIKNRISVISLRKTKKPIELSKVLDRKQFISSVFFLSNKTINPFKAKNGKNRAKTKSIKISDLFSIVMFWSEIWNKFDESVRLRWKRKRNSTAI